MKGRGTHRLIPLEEDNAATLVTCCQVVASGVELDGRYDVGWMEMRIKNRRREREGDTLGDVLDLALVAKALGKTPAA